MWKGNSFRKSFESPLVYPYPKDTPNSDHGLSSPPQKLRPWSECLLSPGKHRVWGGLGFGPSFSRTMV